MGMLRRGVVVSGMWLRRRCVPLMVPDDILTSSGEGPSLWDLRVPWKRLRSDQTGRSLPTIRESPSYPDSNPHSYPTSLLFLPLLSRNTDASRSWNSGLALCLWFSTRNEIAEYWDKDHHGP